MEVATEVVRRMAGNSEVTRVLGVPISIGSGLDGTVRQDETGWKESRLTIPVHGPNGIAVVHIIGGKAHGPWTFTTFEVDFATQHKKLDMVSGRIVEYDPQGYVEVHTQAASAPEFSPARNNVASPAPRLDGRYPCLFATVQVNSVTPQIGSCSLPFMYQGAIDRFEADLRYGRFVLRETDLFLQDVFEVPLTRTYASSDWVHSNPVHAFGRNSNHPFDIAPLGTRNPYTYQFIALEDSDMVYFDRISKGTGYSDAVYEHTETSTKFYGATQRWNGGGWTTKLSDGSEIHFPESYNARNMAQGAATEIVDGKGNRLELKRDAQRNLQEIRTPHGHWIKFTYDDASRIVRAEDDAGKWASYTYNRDGMLQDVSLSSGRGRHYEYVGVLMTRITDEKGTVLLRNRYQDGLLTAQEFKNQDDYSYNYRWNDSRRYVDSARIVLPNGKEEELQMGNFVSEIVKNPNH
jgi:YD repeat-containing protein